MTRIPSRVSTMPELLRSASQTTNAERNLFTLLVLGAYTAGTGMQEVSDAAMVLALGRLDFLSLPKRNWATGRRRTKFVWSSYTDYDIKANCRFSKLQIDELIYALDVPDVVKTRKGDVCSAHEAVVTLLYRLSFPNTWDRSVQFLTNRNRTGSTRIFYHMLNHVYGFRHAIQDVNKWKDSMPLFAAALAHKGNLMPNCFGFIDGTFQEICRPGGGVSALTPGGYQREMYNGHYKHHGFKYQGLILPNGLYGDFFGE